MIKFRPLRSDEIECRIATVKSTGISLLLYKDARCDMIILDEEIGPENWQRTHSRDNANCTVSIWDAEKEMWIPKEDTGTESFTEKEKGLASDSFKRACVNWGIGRELYTAPFIWVPSSECIIKERQSNGKTTGYTCFDKFYVSNIGYDDKRCIDKLQIKNSKSHKVVFELGKIENQEPVPEPDKPATEAQKKTIRSLCEKHKKDIDMVYAVNNVSEDTMTEKQAGALLEAFKRKYGDN